MERLYRVWRQIASSTASHAASGAQTFDDLEPRRDFRHRAAGLVETVRSLFDDFRGVIARQLINRPRLIADAPGGADGRPCTPCHQRLADTSGDRMQSLTLHPISLGVPDAQEVRRWRELVMSFPDCVEASIEEQEDLDGCRGLAGLTLLGDAEPAEAPNEQAQVVASDAGVPVQEQVLEDGRLE